MLYWRLRIEGHFKGLVARRHGVVASGQPKAEIHAIAVIPLSLAWHHLRNQMREDAVKPGQIRRTVQPPVVFVIFHPATPKPTFKKTDDASMRYSTPQNTKILCTVVVVRFADAECGLLWLESGNGFQYVATQ